MRPITGIKQKKMRKQVKIRGNNSNNTSNSLKKIIDICCKFPM